jgi:uncharacterized membrane protein
MKCVVVALISLLTAVPALADATGYSCSGTEPFWSLKIDGTKASFETPDTGKAIFDVAAGKSAAGMSVDTVTVYDSAVAKTTVTVIAAALTGGKCNDGMSDRLYDYQTVVTAPGHVYYGCCTLLEGRK